MKLILTYIRKHLGIFLLSTFFLASEALCDLLQPTFMSYIVDDGVRNADIGRILFYGLIMTGIALCGAFCAVMRNRFASRTSQTVGKELRRDMYRSVQRLSMENIDRLQPASIITRITNDVTQVQEFINSMMRMMVKAPLTCIGAIVLITIQTPVQAPVIVAIVFAAALLIFGNMKIAYPRFGRVQSKLDRLNGVTREYLSAVRVVKAFRAEKEEAKKFEEASFELLDEQSEPEDRKNAAPLVRPRGDIELRHVSFCYLPGQPVLKDISVKIPAGTQTAIVGTTGSGKTTVINLLTRFYDVSEGCIFLDGHDLRDYRMEDLREAFGVVLQDTALFAATVSENICYGHPEAGQEQIRQAAKTAGADGFIERLPQGYHTVLEQGGMELSQGERQLLTIARAVLADAPILILDEATSSVDTVTEQRIRRALLEICKDRTSVIIAHRLSTIRDSDLILLLENGEIAEQGTHEELMNLDGRYAQMYKMQTGTYEKAAKAAEREGA